MAMASKAVRRATKARKRLAVVPNRPRLDDNTRQYAQCRALGHEWQHQGPVEEPGRGVVFGARGLRSTCNDCGMERIKWITQGGEVHTRYHQPENYAQHGDDKLTSQGWRTAFYTIVFG